MPNRSTFVAPNYIPDQFTDLLDLPPSQMANAKRYQELKTKTIPLTPSEQTELNNLTQILQDYLITPERWNKFQDALVNMQWFLKDSVEGYIDKKQTEMQSYVDTKKSELQTEIDKFTFLGTYSPTTTYNKKNIVEYNGEAYICLIDGTTNISPTNATNWAKIAQKGAKGDKGDPGLNLVYKGTYDPNTQYKTGDAVEYGGSIYYAKQNSIGETPQSNGTSWTIFMARASVLISSTTPSSSTDKMIWVDSNTNIFKYYNSATSSWIELNANDAKTLGGQTLSQIQSDYNNKIGNLSNLNTTDKDSLADAINEIKQDQVSHSVETASKFTSINLNIIDMAVELETLKGATLNGVTANIFVETFTNLNDINLMNGVYDSTNKRLVL